MCLTQTKLEWFPLMLYVWPKHRVLNLHMQRCGPEKSLEQHEGAGVWETLLLLGSPSVLWIKVLSLWKTWTAMLVGSSRWRAVATSTHSSFPTCSLALRATALPVTCKRGAVCFRTLAIRPGLILSLSSNKVRRHLVASGLSQAARRACTDPHW